MRDIIIRTTAASGRKDGSIRYWLSSGPGNLDLTPAASAEPGFFVMIFPGLAYPEKWKTDGVRVMTSREALANTSFSVLTPGGDVIRELIGAFPSLVLAEGEYVAIARHEDRTYQATFKVQSGQDRDVEVLAEQPAPEAKP